MDNSEPLTSGGTEKLTFHRQMISLISEILQVDLSPDTDDVSRKGLDAWDSVNHLRLAMELEEVFQVSLEDDVWPDLMSLREVEAYLIKQGANTNGQGSG